MARVHKAVILTEQLLARIFGNRAELVVGVSDHSARVGDGDDGVSIKRGFEIAEGGVGRLQFGGALRHPLLQSGGELADFLLRPLPLDGDAHDIHRPRDQIQLGGGGTARLPVVNAKGSQKSAAVIMNRRGPGRAQAVLSRHAAVVRPQRVGEDVRDDDLPVEMRRRAAGGGGGAGDQAVERAVEGLRQARCRRGFELPAFELADGTERARQLFFNA